RHPPTPPLFPYTTLFRSFSSRSCHGHRTTTSRRGRSGKGPSSKRERTVGQRRVQSGCQAFPTGRAALPKGRKDHRSRTDIKYFQDRKSTRLNSSHVSISY